MFTHEKFLFVLTALQPINQSDSEPSGYKNNPDKKAVTMRTFSFLPTAGGHTEQVPFISAESLVHHLRDALWRSILRRYHLRLDDFRSPVGATLTYLMMNGGDANIGQKLEPYVDAEKIAAMPEKFPLLGAFGYTLGGIFTPSLVRVSFILPFSDVLPIWQDYRNAANPDAVTTPRPLELHKCLVRADGSDYDYSISYYRHPVANMGQFYRRLSNKEKKQRQNAAIAAGNLSAPLEDLLLTEFQPMPHTFEYIPVNTPLAFTLQFDQEASTLVRSMVRYAFDQWLGVDRQVSLGGHVNRGFGLVRFENYPPTDTNQSFPTAAVFEDWLTQHDAALEQLLHQFKDFSRQHQDVTTDSQAFFDLIDKLFAL